MASKNAKRIVVDASVARSAGGEQTQHPQAKNCRDFLITMKKYDHRIVLTPEIIQEWRKHRSKFARRWLVDMFGSKKVVRLDELDDADLHEKIAQYASSDKQRDAMLKDVLLVSAAHATDKIVASLDDVVRGHFAVTSATVSMLRDIVWTNPSHDEEACIQWLKDGANADDFRLLRNYAK